MKTRYLLAAAAFASAAIIPAQAIIVGGAVTAGAGTFVQLPVPLTGSTPANTVGNDNFQSPNLFAFNESQNALVGPTALAVDEVPGGGAGTIAAGTIVASHYVFFDPVNNSQAGYVDFDAKILGVVSSTPNLLASDYLANTGVHYLNPSARGLEAGDSAVIDSVLNYRVVVDWMAATPGDYIRVLTAFSPGAPTPDGGSSALLLGLGTLGFAALRRKSA